MYGAMSAALSKADADPTVRVHVFLGVPGAFSAGNDLADFLAVRPADGEEIPVWRLLRALAECEVPIVAAVHGNCVGIGTTMLLHCDLVVAADSARFSMPFVDLGLVPEAASSLLFPRLAGRRRAARYLLLAEPFGAEEALDIGLVSHVVGASELDQAMGGIVQGLLAKPPEALRLTQRLLRGGTREDILERMRMEGSLFAERLESPEVRQAIEHFFAKRAAKAAAP
jgi:enoyl-CoA hydratase/carnithine racemase